MQRKLTPAQKRAILLRRKKQRRRKQIRTVLILLAVVILIAVLALLIVKPGGRDEQIRPVSTPEITAEPTAQPTPEITQAPTPTPEPLPEIPLGIYAPDGSGVRWRMSEFVSNWKRGQDIDCFEVLVSDASTLSGKNFYSICRDCWATLPDPYAMKIGYTLRYTLADGREISMTIRKPSDITHTEYVECYLYDDVHTSGGFYTHLSDSGMKDNTLITSIKITCGRQIDQVQQMYLGAFLYDRESMFDASGNYTGPWYQEISIRRKG